MTLQPKYNSMLYNVAMALSFGEWLRQHRKKAKMTQQDVASRAGLSFSYISTLERNQPHSLTGNPILPIREKVILIARAVGGDVDEALELCGYTSGEPQGKPRTLPELVAALERLGIEMPQFYGGIPNDPEQEGFAEAVERIFLDIQLVTNRLAKGRKVRHTLENLEIADDPSIPNESLEPLQKAK